MTGTNGEMESCVKLLKYGCHKAPNISLPLLDARAGIKRELGLGNKESQGVKWSDIQEMVNSRLDEALEHFNEAKNSFAPLDFAPVNGTTNIQPVTPSEFHGSGGRSAKAIEWACGHSLLWWREIKNLGARLEASKWCLYFPEDNQWGRRLWLCSTIFNSSGYFLGCRYEESEDKIIFPKKPEDIVAMSSVELFLQYYEDCQKGAEILPLLLQLDWERASLESVFNDVSEAWSDGPALKPMTSEMPIKRKPPKKKDTRTSSSKTMVENVEDAAETETAEDELATMLESLIMTENAAVTTGTTEDIDIDLNEEEIEEWNATQSNEANKKNK